VSKPTDIVNRWVRPEIRKLSAYHVPDARDVIKLDAMENPYHWPADKEEEWLSLVRDVELNRYPDPSPASLKAVLAEAMDIPAGMNVLLGNGSDELIQMIAMAVAQPGRVIMAPEPTFVMYQMIATFTGLDYVGISLNEDFSLDTPAMLAAIEQHQPAVIFLAYPNNPTGNLFNRDDIVQIFNASSGLVVVDEAYHAFAGDSFMDELGKHDNLVVMRTVSKMGLAGLRLGCLAGSTEWLSEFDKVRLPYNINVLTQVSAEFAMKNRAMMDQQTRQICADRELLTQSLQKRDEIEVFPSKANFILFRTGGATGIFESLRSQGVLIKDLSRSGGALKDCLRVTVGTASENLAFLSALDVALKKAGS